MPLCTLGSGVRGRTFPSRLLTASAMLLTYTHDNGSLCSYEIIRWVQHVLMHSTHACSAYSAQGMPLASYALAMHTSTYLYAYVVHSSFRLPLDEGLHRTVLPQRLQELPPEARAGACRVSTTHTHTHTHLNLGVAQVHKHRGDPMLWKRLHTYHSS